MNEHTNEHINERTNEHARERMRANGTDRISRRRSEAREEKRLNRQSRRQGETAFPEDAVTVAALGGVAEIGKNCTALACGNDLLVIDAGVKFPEEELLGVDLIIPDIAFIQRRRRFLRGLCITHGHEDHIGALPYILPELARGGRPALYGTRMALGLVRARLDERGIPPGIADWFPVEPGERRRLGGIEVEYLAVGHSIPDAAAVIFHTPAGRVLHMGDWKFDGMPEESLRRLRQLGDEGLLALLPDCVRVEIPGRTPPESVVLQELERIMRAAPGRVIVSLFASNLSRMAAIIRLAHRLGRVTALVGRSIERNFEVAGELGYLDIPPGALISVAQAARRAPRQVVVICTGSQGEPTSALARIAAGTHPHIHLRPGDTVVLSATPVPGNEEDVARTIDNLFRAGAEVFYPTTTPGVHVSGHASRDEHAELLRLVRPRYVVPLHGEYRMMAQYRKLAIEQGIPAENVLLLDVGDAVALRAGAQPVRDHVPAGAVLVDGLTVGAVTQVVLRDRRRLAGEGLVVAAVALDRHTGRPVAEPELILRGLPEGVDGSLAEEARRRLRRTLARLHRGEVQHRLVGEVIQESLGALIYQRTGLRPMVLPVVTEV
jgi:ribonuclease J